MQVLGHAERDGARLRHPCEQDARRCRIDGDLGQSFGADLTEREVRYLMSVEWARTAEDIVWRLQARIAVVSGGDRRA
jgi:glycerol-3-phosphate dehydrogenase